VQIQQALDGICPRQTGVGQEERLAVPHEVQDDQRRLGGIPHLLEGGVEGADKTDIRAPVWSVNRQIQTWQAHQVKLWIVVPRPRHATHSNSSWCQCAEAMKQAGRRAGLPRSVGKANDRAGLSRQRE
jgi:hypothetical protein